MAANAAMILLRGGWLTVSFLVRVLFLPGESCFVRRARTPGRLAFLSNYERTGDGFSQPALGRFAIAELAARVAGYYTDCAINAEPRRETRDEHRALLVGESVRRRNVP